MVRSIEWTTFDGGVQYKVFTGLHDDTKPTEYLANGSVYIEIDTGDVWFYDEENEEWIMPGGDQNG